MNLSVSLVGPQKQPWQNRLVLEEQGLLAYDRVTDVDAYLQLTEWLSKTGLKGLLLNKIFPQLSDNYQANPVYQSLTTGIDVLISPQEMEYMATKRLSGYIMLQKQGITPFWSLINYMVQRMIIDQRLNPTPERPDSAIVLAPIIQYSLSYRMPDGNVCSPNTLWLETNLYVGPAKIRTYQQPPDNRFAVKAR